MSKPLLFFSLLFVFLHSSNGQQLAPIQAIQVTEGVPFDVCLTIDQSPSGGDFVVNVRGNVPILQNLNETVTFVDGTTELTQCFTTVKPADRVVENFMIISDAFSVTTTFQGVTSSPMIMGQIALTDGTVLTIGFSQPSYTFFEGVQGNQICVSVDGTTVSSFSATIEYVTGTATLDDFVGTMTTLTFDANTANMMECVLLNINNDTLFEGAESLTVQLVTANTPLSIDPSRDMATIIILDLDANCGAPPSGTGVTPTPTSPPYGPMAGMLVANPGAVATYFCTDPSLVVLGNNQLTCTENMTGVSVEWRPSQVPICAEARTIGFSQSVYLFVEGATGQICVTVDNAPPDPIVISAAISYIPGTANASDYTGSTEVMFTSNSSSMECASVNLTGDSLFEGAEMFTVQLSTTTNGVIVDSARNMSVITILDLQANCGPPPMRDGVTVAPSNPPYGVFPPIGLVANPGAVATYSCIDPNLVLMGSSMLTCSSDAMATAEWTPADAPTCVESTDPPTVPTTPSVSAGAVLSSCASFMLTIASISLVAYFM